MRLFRTAIALTTLLFAITFLMSSATAAQQKLDLVQMVLHDPAAPNAGNPKGDVTIVAFLDYNCPFCRRSTPELNKFLVSDPNVKVIYKDWPILSDASVMEAKVALAANYQGKYQAAHNALMAIKMRPASKAAVKAALQTAGINIDHLNADLAAHNDDIGALLQRNLAEADALHLQGTPVFLIGPFLVASVLDEAGFRRVVAEVRDAQKPDQPAARSK